MTETAMTLAKIAEERLTPEGRRDRLIKKAGEIVAGFNEEQTARLAELLAHKEADDEAKEAADDCVAAGQLIMQGFMAEAKTANIDFESISEFTAGIKEAGGDVKKVAADFVELVKFREQVIAQVEAQASES